MRNAIILHGTCSEKEYFDEKERSLSNSNWLPWLQKRLLMNEILTQTPEMPEAYKPDYEKWRREFSKLEVNEETILIGHSCGAGFLLRWLSEDKSLRPAKLLLVAPWLDPKKLLTGDFFNFTIDRELPARIGEFHLLVSKNDDQEGLESARIIREAFPDITLHEFADRGHFTYEDMKTEKFPELLNIIV